MAEHFLYLTTTGWKSGRPHEIEIWFVEYEGRFYIVSEHRERSHWVRNVRQHPAVTWRIGNRAAGEYDGPVYTGSARALDASTEPELHAAVAALMDAKYDWSDGLIVELAPDTGPDGGG